MKHFILYLVFLVYYAQSLAQSNSKSAEIEKYTPRETRWDINMYVWSHRILNMEDKSTKSLLDFRAIDNWSTLSDYVSITEDGKYFAYSIQKGPGYRKPDSIIIQSTENIWRDAFVASSPGCFLQNNKHYIYLEGDRLCLLQIGTSNRSYIDNVVSFKLISKSGDQWLICHLKSKKLLFRNMISGFENKLENVFAFEFSGDWVIAKTASHDDTWGLLVFNPFINRKLQIRNVKDFKFDSGGKALALRIVQITEIGKIESLEYYSLTTGFSQTILTLKDSVLKVIDYCIDHSGKQVAYLIEKQCDTLLGVQLERSIWWWREGMNKAELRAGNNMPDISPQMVILHLPAISFTDNDEYIQFNLQTRNKILEEVDNNSVQLDVWNYKDTFLQTNKAGLIRRPEGFKAIASIETGKIIRIEREFEKLKCIRGNYAVVAKTGREVYGDRFWEKGYLIDSNWLVSLKENYRKLLPTNTYGDMEFSPNGNFLVYYDAEKEGNYFSLNISNLRLNNISRGIPSWRLGYKSKYMRTHKKPQYPSGIAEWIEKDSTLLVYDNFDIWQLDLSGEKSPVNITNGYGYKNNIVFNLMNSDIGKPLIRSEISPFVGKDTLLLRAFNNQNKFNGFYIKVLGTIDDPKLLYMGPTLFTRLLNSVDGFNDGMIPLKSSGSNTWIVKKQMVNDAPNYFVTNDFKTYTRLSNLQPHVKYNWLTSELHTFKQLDGSVSHGVLYKPENFNPNIKYPVIISFYGHLSDRVYQYPHPSYLTQPSIFDDPTWMVSHGYLVFTPDIYFTSGKWGPSTINTLEGAAKYLGNLPYVNNKKIGAAGHSNSGRFGYYLYTHSKLFAAMSFGSGNGGINLLSVALSDGDFLEWAETDSYGGGLGNLWENKASWIDHTGVLQADKSQSPLLLFLNNKDWFNGRQGMELFISLRRLQKKAWWLQYDQGAHTVGMLRDRKDFTIRYTQFFDHFLKDAPAPLWMTKGIRATMKGIETGYEMDPAGNCGLNENICKVCNRWNKQFGKTPSMFSKPFSEWHVDESGIQNPKQKLKSVKSK